MTADRSPRVGALLLAGGSGSRFGSRPKQFQFLDHRRRLVDAALETVTAVAHLVVLVLPRGRVADGPWDGAAVDGIATAGNDRLGSVRAGLRVLADLEDDHGDGPSTCDIILVHDAAHPLASMESATSVIAAVAAGADAAVPWLPVVDVLKRRQPDGSLQTAGRDGLGQAQTPHAFRADLLRAIHADPVRSATDDSPTAWEDTQLIEQQGGRVVGVEGDAGNIHVVTPADLDVVRRLARLL